MHIFSLTIEGFGCFKESQTIQFNSRNMITIVGLNGSEKSTLQMAIAFVLCRTADFDETIITGISKSAIVSIIMLDQEYNAVEFRRELRLNQEESYFVEDIRTKKHYYEWALYSMGFNEDASFFLFDTKCLDYLTHGSDKERLNLLLHFSGIGDIKQRIYRPHYMEKLVLNAKQKASTHIEVEKSLNNLIPRQTVSLSSYNNLVASKNMFEKYLVAFSKIASLGQLLASDTSMTRLEDAIIDCDDRIAALKKVRESEIKRSSLFQPEEVYYNEMLISENSLLHEITQSPKSASTPPPPEEELLYFGGFPNFDAYSREKGLLIYKWCSEIFNEQVLSSRFNFMDELGQEYYNNIRRQLINKLNAKINDLKSTLLISESHHEYLTSLIDGTDLHSRKKINELNNDPIELELIRDMHFEGVKDRYQNLIDQVDIEFRLRAKSFYPVLETIRKTNIAPNYYFGPLALWINTDLSEFLHQAAVRLHSKSMFAHVVSTSEIADLITSNMSEIDEFHNGDFELEFIVLDRVPPDSKTFQRVLRCTESVNNEIEKNSHRDNYRVVDVVSTSFLSASSDPSREDSACCRHLVQPLLQYCDKTSQMKHLYRHLYDNFIVSGDQNILIQINEARHFHGITPDGKTLITENGSSFDGIPNFQVKTIVELYNTVQQLLNGEWSRPSNNCREFNMSTEDYEQIKAQNSFDLNKTVRTRDRVKDKVRIMHKELEFLNSFLYDMEHFKLREIPGFTDSTKENLFNVKPPHVRTITTQGSHIASNLMFTTHSPEVCVGNVVGANNQWYRNEDALELCSSWHHEHNIALKKIDTITAEITKEESTRLKYVKLLKLFNNTLKECKSLDDIIRGEQSNFAECVSERWNDCYRFFSTPESMQNKEELYRVTQNAFDGCEKTQKALEDIECQMEGLKGYIDIMNPKSSISDHMLEYESYQNDAHRLDQFLSSDWMIDYASMEYLDSIESRQENFFVKLQSGFAIIFERLTGISGTLNVTRDTQNRFTGLSFCISSEKISDLTALPFKAVNSGGIDKTRSQLPSAGKGESRYPRVIPSRGRSHRRDLNQDILKHIPHIISDLSSSSDIDSDSEEEIDIQQLQELQDESKIQADVIPSGANNKRASPESRLHENGMNSFEGGAVRSKYNDAISFDDSSGLSFKLSHDYRGHQKRESSYDNSGAQNCESSHEDAEEEEPTSNQNEAFIDLPGSNSSECTLYESLSYSQNRAAALALLLSLHLYESDKVFLIDEIDADLDPILRLRLANTIKELSTTYNIQYIVTSHFSTIITLSDKCYAVVRSRLHNGTQDNSSVVRRIAKKGALQLTNQGENFDFSA